MEETKINKKNWKIGELAKLTGLTVRTLHHYDQIGLLSSSQYSDTGHRLYTKEDITQLQQIISLKQLGFSLAEIKEFMENPNFNPVEVIKMQLESVKERVRLQEQLRSQLEGIYELLKIQQEVNIEQLIQLIEVINLLNVEKYVTQEEIEELRNRVDQKFTLEERKQMENEWSKLMDQVRAEMKKNTPPDHPTVTQLAKRWKELTNQFLEKYYTQQELKELKKVTEQYPSIEGEHIKENGNEWSNISINGYTANIEVDEALHYGNDVEIEKYIQKAMSHI